MSPALPGDPIPEYGISGLVFWEGTWNHSKEPLWAGVSWFGTIFHSIINSPKDPCRVFLKVLYYRGAVYAPEPGFGLWKAGVGIKQREARLGAVCVPDCKHTFLWI